ncbi:MAG: hypothetical protein LBH30_04595 [Prevotellaceae bacterium]|jgi:hypothetical protein|nr:hypothetical protein [Prevotellaceae bacterium]
MTTRKIKPKGVKILKIFHIFFAFCWIIGGVALCLLSFITFPESGDELYMRSRILQIIDDYMIICGALGALITGLIYSIWTNWGFFKHLWVSVKWGMIILQILYGTFVLGPCINDNVIIADRLRDDALTDPVFLYNILVSQTGGTIQLAFLLAVMVISVWKPWKKRK